jgi:cytochrome c oxidase subunit 2
MSDTAAPVDVIEGSPGAPDAGAEQPRHFVRMVAIWLVLSAIAVPVFYFLVGPHVPPGTMTSSAEENQFDFNILMVIALPVLIAVWVYLGYSIVVWRASRAADPVGGAVARGHMRVQAGWIAITSVIVLFLAGFGTAELIANNGAGGGEGPNPVWTPTAAHILPVQVIGQQWKFVYRYPSFGGFESQQLVLPADSSIAFHVTSLDVIHSFWAYQLSVKADANPQVDNIAYTSTRATGAFTVRCSELCGLWHGAMYNYGKVVAKDQFESWAKATQLATASNTKLLPPFAWTYVPDANGAGGGYYNDTVVPYSPSEVYGAKQPAS